MRKLCSIFLLFSTLIGFTSLPSLASVMHHRNVSFHTLRTTYSCKIRKQRCTVYKISYMERNRAHYSAQCTGDAFEQGAYTKAVETDVRRKRFEYCSPNM